MNNAVTEATFWMPKGASTVAGDVDALYYFIYWLSVVLIIGIVGSMTYFVFRYKRKSTDEIPHGANGTLVLVEEALRAAGWSPRDTERAPAAVAVPPRD